MRDIFFVYQFRGKHDPCDQFRGGLHSLPYSRHVLNAHWLRVICGTLHKLFNRYALIYRLLMSNIASAVPTIIGVETYEEKTNL